MSATVSGLVKQRWLRLGLIVAVTAAVLLCGSLSGLSHPGRASAAGGGVDFSPAQGSAADLRTISFFGFANGEVIELTFFDPSGQQVQVGETNVFYASAQDDGTGAFYFRASDWLSPVASGKWTVKVYGETSNQEVSTDFYIS